MGRVGWHSVSAAACHRAGSWCQGWALLTRGSPDLLGKVPREEVSRLHTPGKDEPGVRGSRGESLRKHWSWPSLCQASAW